jgi:hypothetical protein
VTATGLVSPESSTTLAGAVQLETRLLSQATLNAKVAEAVPEFRTVKVWVVEVSGSTILAAGAVTTTAKGTLYVTVCVPQLVAMSHSVAESVFTPDSTATRPVDVAAVPLDPLVLV